MKEKVIFRLISVAGLILSTSDLYGIIVSSPICKASGCLIVNEITPFGSMPFVVIGIALFSFLLIASFYRRGEDLIDFAVSLAFTFEGALLGFQLFYIHLLCTVCVGIAIVISLLFIMRFFRKRSSKIVFYLAVSGFVGLLLISRMLYIPVWHPLPGKTLIYTLKCPHCENIIREIKNDKTLVRTVRMIKLSQAKGFLMNSGIKSVPVLVLKDKNIRLLVGEKQISENLFKKNSASDIKMLNELKLNQTDSCNFETDNCSLSQHN